MNSLEAEAKALEIDLSRVGRHWCSQCGARLEWTDGPQWSGWIAPDMDGHLRDCCFLDENGWVGHAC
jgi:hypothetical protein